MSKSKIEWTDETNHKIGSIKTAAQKIGVSVEEYLQKINGGYKWCACCGRWLLINNYHRDKSRGDGLKAKCKECSTALWRKKAIFANMERQKSIDDNRIQARRRINHDVEIGIRPNPNDLFCSICGHKGPDKRHEYHHHMGYSKDHHNDILPVCTTCHHKIEGKPYANEN